MSIAELIKAMADAGAPTAAIVIAVEAIEAAQHGAQERQSRRSSAAERQARYRERQKAKAETCDAGNVTGDVTRDASQRDALPPSSPPNDIYSNPPHHPPSDESPVTPRKRRNGEKHLMPDGWRPDEFGPDTKAAPVIAQWSREEFQHQFEKFKSHHTARGNKFANWQAAWGTWVLNSRSFGNGRPTAPSGNSGDGFTRAIDRRLNPGDAQGFAEQPERRAVRPGAGDSQGFLALPAGGR